MEAEDRAREAEIAVSSEDDAASSDNLSSQGSPSQKEEALITELPRTS